MPLRLPNRFAWNPGFARFPFAQSLALIIASYPLGETLAHIEPLDRGPFGGLGSWITGAIIFAVLLYIFLRYARQAHAAVSLLNQRQLPCTRCG